MGAEVLDLILSTYITILIAGQRNLIPIGLGILFLMALLHLRLAILYAALDGYVDYLQFFGIMFFPMVLFAVLALLINAIVTWSAEALQMFIGWGAAVASVHIGGTPLSDAISSPSAIWQLGFDLTRPLWAFLMNLGVLFTPKSAVIALQYWLTYVGTIIWFGIMALHIMLALIEFKAATLAATVLIPWGAWWHTAFIMWSAWRYLFAVGVRLFALVFLLSAAVVTIGFLNPLLTTAAVDPTVDQAWALFWGSFVLACITTALPSLLAGSILGGGQGLGIGSLMAGGMVVMSGVRSGGQIIRGVSNLIRG